MASSADIIICLIKSRISFSKIRNKMSSFESSILSMLASYIVLICLSQPSLAFESLCYRLRWRLAEPVPPERIIRPVTGKSIRCKCLFPISSYRHAAFPKNHVLTNEIICGQSFSAGDPIPASGLWSNNGKRSSNGCSEVSGGAMFYAYNYPEHSSSNTGFEEHEIALFYFVQRADSNVSFVLVHDRPKNEDGGDVELKINAPKLAKTPIGWELKDDPSETYEWDRATGQGRIKQGWVECCTDGASLGPLPPSGYRITFRYTQIEGLTGVKVGSFNDTSNDLSLFELNLDDLRDGIEFTAFKCDQICETKKSCGECSSAEGCAWCGDTCVYKDPTRTSYEGCSQDSWTTDNACCDDCNRERSCDSCARKQGCAWDFELSTCVSGLFTDPTNEFFCTTGNYSWRFRETADRCTFPPGAINDRGRLTNPRITEVDKFCSGRGQPDFEINACSCSQGYFGVDCRFECPGGAANACSGNGVCMKDGFCVCDANWTGEACDLPADQPCRMELGAQCGVILQEGPHAGRCSGSETVGPKCSCFEGFHGLNCTDPCPGMSVTGQGTSCGGHGTCDMITGTCQCDPCFELAENGTCVEKACGPCEFDGECRCDRRTGRRECSCRGARVGPRCQKCSCFNNGACNPISQECECEDPYGGSLCELDCTDAIPGSLVGCISINRCLSSNGGCGENTTCVFEQSMVSRCECISDHATLGDLDQGASCAPINRCQEDPPVCGSNSTCSFLGPNQYECKCDNGTYSVRQQINCTAHRPPCNASLDEMEIAPPTVSSDRECAVPTTTTTPSTTTEMPTESADLEAAQGADDLNIGGLSIYAIGGMLGAVILLVVLVIYVSCKKRPSRRISESKTDQMPLRPPSTLLRPISMLSDASNTSKGSGSTSTSFGSLAMLNIDDLTGPDVEEEVFEIDNLDDLDNVDETIFDQPKEARASTSVFRPASLISDASASRKPTAVEEEFDIGELGEMDAADDDDFHEASQSSAEPHVKGSMKTFRPVSLISTASAQVIQHGSEDEEVIEYIDDDETEL
eukprot:TRINITY_DN11628_c0_g1_i11.p1 TRINITY_DN11628_c0_g1~~TRINITY_DN11628_c0_g1_i11.p1  ORF type:complete len:1035 (+),score=91.97 TRINITY_DN11628_c0_g1_i11:1645-4749(+)